MIPLLPKPPKRTSKPRRRLSRTSSIRRSAKRIARGKLPAKVRQTERAKLGRIATDLCSRITLARAGGQCEAISGLGGKVESRCGCTATEAAHGLGKGPFPSVRYELSNLIAMCHDDHLFFGSAQLVGPSLMRDLLIALRGRKTWESLLTLAAQTRKQDMAEVVRMLREHAARLGIKP